MRKHDMERHAGKRLKGGDKNGRILCRHIYTSVAQRSVRGREDPIRGFDSRLGCACAARFIFGESAA